MTKVLTGAAFNLNQKTVVEIDTINSTFVCDSSVGAVDVITTGVTVQLCGVTRSPRVGDLHKINALGGDVIVTGGTYPIVGNGNLVPQNTSTWYELVKTLGDTFAWVPLTGGGGGYGEILTGTIAKMAALVTASLLDHIYARPQDTVDAPFELDKTSTADADGITVIYTLESVNGTLPGRWIRRNVQNSRFAKQIDWYVDSTQGNDENDGTVANPLQTAAEVCRRLHQAAAGRNYQVNLVRDVPFVEALLRPFATVAVKDSFRPSFLAEANHEDVSGTTGYETTYNMTLKGPALSTATVLESGAITTFTATNVATNFQNTIVTATNLAGYVGRRMRIATGASLGACAAVLKDLGAGEYRCSRFLKEDGTEVNPANGSQFTIIDPVKWYPPLIQIGSSQGRFHIQDLQFPDVDPAPADQEILTLRYQSTAFTRCDFRRNSKTGTGTGTAVEFGHSCNTALTNCIFDYTLLVGDGIAGMAIVSLGNGFSVVAATACAFLNADVRVIRGAETAFTACVVQGGHVTTMNPSTFVSYGAFNVGVGFTHAEIAVFGAQGLGIFDWPVSGTEDYGLKIAGGSICNIASGSSLYGINATANSIGVRAQGGGKLFWLTGGATAPTISGNLYDLLLESSTAAVPPMDAWQQSGTGATLVAGTLVVAANLVAGSSIVVTMMDPGAGAITGMAALDVPLASRVNGAPGSFTVNAIDDAKALIATAECTFDWVVITPTTFLRTWAEWAAAPFQRRAMNYSTGSCIAQAAA